MTHIDDDVLDEYVIDVDRTMPGRAAIEAHLNQCLQCRTRAGSTAVFLEMIVSPEAWETAEAVIDAEGHRQGLVVFAARVQDEYAQASARFSPFLNDALAFVHERVERRPEYRTAGAVRVLTEAAHACCEREPMHARNIAEAAVLIADQLPQNEYPAPVVHSLRGLAWKERANAMRFIGEYPEALVSLDRSEREFRQLLVPSIEIGNTAYIRAVVLTYMDRLDEAERFASESADVFAAFRDSERWLLSTAAQAAILYYRSDYASALTIFERLLKHAEADGAMVEIARHSTNAGVCCVKIGDTAQAAGHLLNARQIYTQLQNALELGRVERWMAVLSRVDGDITESITRLRRVRSEFERVSLLDDAALATIDLVESLIIAGQRSEIAQLCNDTTRYIRRAGNNRQAFISWCRRAVDVYLAACYCARSRATTSEFADNFGVTPQSLTRIFRRLFQQTPLEYFRLRQLQHAALLLEQSQSPQTIAQIAEESAFGTRATLFRRFEDQFGVTPEEYRRLTHRL
jgi:AraC-like DNA-binding protein